MSRNSSAIKSPPPETRKFYLLGIAGILLSEFLIRDLFLPTPPSNESIAISLLLEWLLFLALIFFWIPKVEGGRMAEIGVTRFRPRHLAIGLVAFGIAFVLSALISYLLDLLGLLTLRSLQSTLSKLHPVTLFGLFLTGTILEEFVYRGYLIERLTFLSGRLWLAGVFSWLLFTVVHWKFVGFIPLLEIGALAAVYTFIYLRESSVWPCVVCHGLNSAMVYLIFPLLMP